VARRPRLTDENPTVSPQHLLSLVRSTVPPVHPAGLPFISAGLGLALLGRRSRWLRRSGLLAAGAAGQTSSGAMPGMDMPSPTIGQGDISFPYEFPEPGRYRLWIQVKSAGQILTGVFDIDVAKAN